MISIDWSLFVLMLSGTAAISASISLVLSCFIMRHETTPPKRKSGLCGRCKAVKCDVCKVEGMYVGYEEAESEK